MKKCLILVAVLFLFKGFAQGNNEAVNVLLEKMISEKTVAGVVAGYSIDGKTIGISSAGYANKKEKKKFELETKVRMGSIAKSMTALAAMQLVEKGLLDIDVPIQTYITDYPEQEKTQITARHLLSHTSGIPGYKDGKESNITTEYSTLYDALDLFKERELLFEPGTQYNYTTYGYTVLGVVIERVSGLTFEDYMQKNIWDKAGMTNTGVEKFNVKLDNESELYTRNNGKGKAKLAEENNLSNRLPGGGFYTTVVDMLKFGNAVLNNTFVKKETLDVMREHHSLEKVENGYGFGWFLYGRGENPEGALIGHPGGQIGNTSLLFILPKRKIVTIILANTSRAQSSVDPVLGELFTIALEQSKLED